MDDRSEVRMCSDVAVEAGDRQASRATLGAAPQSARGDRTASLGKDAAPTKAGAWSLGSIRKPFLEHLKRTDTGVAGCWGKRRSPVVSNPMAMGMNVMRRFSKGEIVSTDLGELDCMLDGTIQEENNNEQVSTWRGLMPLLIACVFSICGSCIMWTTDAFDNFVARQMILDNSSSTFGWWINPPISPWLKVYLWNYTNMEDYMRNNKTKLKLEEVGPYIFRENIARSEIVFNNDKTLLSYKESRWYDFFPERSGASMNATVSVPNMPYLSAVAKAPPVSWTLNHEPIIKLRAGDFIYGYQDHLFTMSKIVPGNTPPYEKFGLLAPRMVPDRYTIHTGLADVGKLAFITVFNDLTELSAWPRKECNSISGTDGTMFPPLDILNKRPVKAFKGEACRLVDFEYQKTTVAQGLRAHRYVIPPGLFLSPRTHPEELCFCNKTDVNECPLDGVFSTSPCSFGAPVLVSFPHFHRGDPKLLEPFEGLSPDPEQHDMWADIHPRMGVTMQGRSRLQVNMQVVRSWSPWQTKMQIFPDKFVLPVAWVEQSLPSYQAGFKAFLFTVSYTLDFTEFVLLYILPVVAVVTAFFIVRRLLRRRDALQGAHREGALRKVDVAG